MGSSSARLELKTIYSSDDVTMLANGVQNELHIKSTKSTPTDSHVSHLAKQKRITLIREVPSMSAIPNLQDQSIDEYFNNSVPKKRHGVLYDHYQNAARLVIMVVLLAFASVVIGMKIRDLWPNTSKQLVLVVILLLGFIVFFGLMMTLIYGNDSTISAMLSQRWNPLSFLAGVFASMFCSFAAGYVSVSFAADCKEPRFYSTFCTACAFFFTELVVIFPLYVEKTSNELGMIPGFEKREDGRETVIAVHGVFARVNRNESEDPKDWTYIPRLLPMPVKLMNFSHYGVIGVGHILAYGCILEFLIRRKFDVANLNVLAVLIYFCVSVLGVSVVGLCMVVPSLDKSRLLFTAEIFEMWAWGAGLIILTMEDSCFWKT